MVEFTADSSLPSGTHAVKPPRFFPGKFSCLSVLVILTGMLLLVTIVRAVIALPHGAGLTDESGVLAGLAMDAVHGVFYRPLMSELGYGGTRYGPLYIAFHALLIRLLHSPIWSGYTIAACSAVGLIFAQFRILRTAGVAPALAGAGAILFIATAPGQFAVTTIRADMLATMLSITGVLLVIRAAGGAAAANPDKPLQLTWPAIAFALAGLTKFTTIFGIAASFAWLVLNRRWRSAVAVACMTLVFWLIGVGGFDLLSHGRMLVNWRACANGGRPPLHLHQWINVLKQAWVLGDPCGLLAVIAAALAWLLSPVRIKFGLPGLLFICSASFTPMMFFSPGIASNSLLDADVAAILFLASLCTGPSGRWIPMVAMIAIACVGVYDTARLCRKATYNRLAFFQMELTKAGYTGGPIFSDHSLIPVAAGQSPFLLDDFNLPVVRTQVPQMQQDLNDRIDRAYFQAVILRYDPAEADHDWAFGHGFNARLLAHYQLVEKTTGWDRLWVYRRRTQLPHE